MKIELRPLAEIKPYEKNPRLNDGAVDAVAESIRRFGFRQPIVVDADGVIVVGHTRWKAAVRLGLDKVPVHVGHELTPEQAKAYRIADNKTGDLATWVLELLPGEFADGSGRVLHGKGGRSRTVGLDPGAAAIIERWLDARSRLGLGGRHPLFCTLRGHPMAAAYVRVMLKRLAARADIDKRVHAHGLRHTHAAQLRAEGIDIAIISRQLGHASITTTARYLDHLAPRAVIEAMRRRSWTGA